MNDESPRGEADHSRELRDLKLRLHTVDSATAARCLKTPHFGVCWPNPT